MLYAFPQNLRHTDRRSFLFIGAVLILVLVLVKFFFSLAEKHHQLTSAKARAYLIASSTVLSVFTLSLFLFLIRATNTQYSLLTVVSLLKQLFCWLVFCSLLMCAVTLYIRQGARIPAAAAAKAIAKQETNSTKIQFNHQIQ